MKFKNPTHTQSWKELGEHFNNIKDVHMSDWFAQDKQRNETFSLVWEDVFLDFSKNRIDENTLSLLMSFAREMNLEAGIASCLKGEITNHTEERAVLHTALRSETTSVPKLEKLLAEVLEEKKRIQQFVEAILSGRKKGSTNKIFTDVVNIGIGGSDLGPKMVVNALENYHEGIKTHFLSNIDVDHRAHLFSSLNPETTLFIIVSKSFTTRETIENANFAKEWLIHHLNDTAIKDHFVAVSACEEEVNAFGIEKYHQFKMWDWVGGRFSLWGGVGLSIALGLGYANYESLLKGAAKADKHFKETKLEQNIPVILALINIWYTNFFGLETKAIIPYRESLKDLIAHLQQAFMESNGKSTDRNGDLVNYKTGNIIFGNTGVNSQHAFFQLFHQGTSVIPTDFIGFCNTKSDDKTLHDQMMANLFAQSKALMLGDEQEDLFRNFSGNKPSNTILIDDLTPESFGKLVAIYEHQIFVEGILLNINSFDQFGVQLGKEISKEIEQDLIKRTNLDHDASTSSLMKHYLTKKQ